MSIVSIAPSELPSLSPAYNVLYVVMGEVTIVDSFDDGGGDDPENPEEPVEEENQNEQSGGD